MKRAISGFRKICQYDFSTTGDDETRVFNVDVPDDELKVNSSYLTLMAILEYLIDTPDCTVSDVRREVFHAISVCNKLEEYFTVAEV